ncbi:MAG: argininosuccinate synthase [Terriglobia bacterium]
MAGKNKVVLAYSGGLDTSVAVKWLQEQRGFDVVAVAVDVGQGEDLALIRDKALAVGAVEARVVDAREKFVAGYVTPVLKANALYEEKYPLISALSRPLISELLVDIAKEVGAGSIAHGCTGKGNDQVRFELSIGSLAPELQIIAPMRETQMTRAEALEYAERHRIPLSTGKKSPYSIDENLWGRTVEGEEIEDLSREPSPGAFQWTTDPADAPEEPEYAELTFEGGVPVAVDGVARSLPEIVKIMNEIGGRHGFGRVDMVENRVVGIKSREVYEAPGALSLIAAHKDLESLTLEKALLRHKRSVEPVYAEMVYSGQWFSPLKNALDAYVDATQEDVEGTVALKFYKGSCAVSTRAAKAGLYDFSLATYGQDDEFSHEAAKGFIDVWGLPLRIWARRHPK